MSKVMITSVTDTSVSRVLRYAIGRTKKFFSLDIDILTDILTENICTITGLVLLFTITKKL